MQAVRRMSTRLSGPTSRTSTSQGPPTASQALATFLTESKRQFLDDVTKPEIAQWVVSMGNEAGDLDTIASSIGFAWLQSSVNKQSAVPFMQFNRADTKLRNENIYALELAGLKADGTELFCADDVPSRNLRAQKFALVDHNRLGNVFARSNPTAEVVAVVDHHEDEGLYKDTANPRVVQSSGSCASHVALLCPKEIPAELATLLLCAIIIDTDGLKPGGKAEDVDRKAAVFLLKHSTYAKPSTPDTQSSGFIHVGDDGSSVHSLPVIKTLASTLAEKKEDVHNLTASELLRRDYKQYSYVPAWDPKVAVINAGLSTVPRKLKYWIGTDGGEVINAASEWMNTNNLHVLGIVTSFSQPTAIDKLKPGKSKGKHKREMLFFVRSPASSLDVDTLANRVFSGIESNGELNATRHKKLNTDKAPWASIPDGTRCRVYSQGNPKLSRKFVGPLVKQILEGNAGAETKSNGAGVASTEAAKDVPANGTTDQARAGAAAEAVQEIPTAV